MPLLSTKLPLSDEYSQALNLHTEALSNLSLTSLRWWHTFAFKPRKSEGKNPAELIEKWDENNFKTWTPTPTPTQ